MRIPHRAQEVYDNFDSFRDMTHAYIPWFDPTTQIKREYVLVGGMWVR